MVDKIHIQNCPYHVGQWIPAIAWTSYYIGFMRLHRNPLILMFKILTIQQVESRRLGKVWAYEFLGNKGFYYLKPMKDSDIPKIIRIRCGQFIG